VPRVMLIGLDCVPPALAFERYAELMPQLSTLRARGAWAKLRSTTPPITVPAWTSMISGRDPGELGLYGFRTRLSDSYALRRVDARDVRCARVWDVLAQSGKRSSVLFVPPSSPPFSLAGELVSCFLHAGDGPSSFPERLSGELAARFGPYLPDVDVAAGPSEALFDALCAMTRQHFATARHLWSTRDPDFLMLVEIGPDRLHHAFFDALDPMHPRHDPHGPFVEFGARYYALLDSELAALCALADEETNVLVASDHGARASRECFLINQWLIEQGLLTLRVTPDEALPLRPEWIDFERTRVWAEGGYYARVFLNVRGREPQGSVAESDADGLCTAVQSALLRVRGAAGEAWQNRVERPRDLFREVRGEAPDLLAFFDELSVRALSLVGSRSLYQERDPRGGDAANHDMLGIFVLSGPNVSARGELPECSIYDVGKSVLSLFDCADDSSWLGSDRTRGP
jgi:predicted AlkP superfamily phosphohydrolase/phosphomutase